MASFSKFGNDLYTGARSFNIVGNRRIWFTVSGVLVLIAILVPVFKGFNFSVEFSGGSLFTVSDAGTPPDQTIATKTVESVVPGEVPKVVIAGRSSVQVTTNLLTTGQTEDVQSALAKAYDVPQSKVASTFIGATWGADITHQAIEALIAFLVLAVIIMALYFRTWKMSVAAIISLAHDLIIVVGVYAILGFEVSPDAVIGLLTILGYSLYDTVVVFDKIRENTSEDGEKSVRTFAESVNLAVNQTPRPIDQHLGGRAAPGRVDPVRRRDAARGGNAARHLARAVRRHPVGNLFDHLRRRAVVLLHARA